MIDIKLSLKPKCSAEHNKPENSKKLEKTSLMGLFAIAFGFMGIFTYGIIFVPLGFLFSVLALFWGQALWGVIGLLLAIIGLVTSPKLLLLIGIAAFAHWFDWNVFVHLMFDMIGIDPSDGQDI
jgi:hypothetical protein